VGLERGNCSQKNGTYVNGTIDAKSFTYNSSKGTLGYNYTNGDALGTGVISGVYPSTGVSSSDLFGAVARGTQMAAPGVNLAAAGLQAFGYVVAPLAMTIANCGAGNCSKSDVAMAVLPEIGALRAGATLFRGGAAVGKGAEILQKSGGFAQAAKDYASLQGAEKIYGSTRVKTLSDGTKAVLYQSTGGSGASTLALQDAAGRTLTKIRY
jgi:hypothetical protein